jgi:TPR repeat protein
MSARVRTVASLLAVIAAGCATQGETAPTWQTVPTPRTGVRTHEPSPPDIAAKHEADCAAGDAAGCHRAALDHYYAPSPENDAIALQRFRKACDAGYAPSCNGVGTMYAAGRAVPQDDVEAVKWFRLACAGDGSTGCEHLADAYENGRGVAKDLDAARAARARARCLLDQAVEADAGTCPAAP